MRSFGQALAWAFMASVLSAHAAGASATRVALHLAPRGERARCSAQVVPSCSDIVTAGDLMPARYFAYVLMVSDEPEHLRAIELGVSYNAAPTEGVDVFEWVTCSALEFPAPEWPGAGSGNLVMWKDAEHCGASTTGTPDHPALMGYFYCAAYTPDELQLTVHPGSDVVSFISCDGGQTPVAASAQPGGILGRASFTAGALASGHNPCAGDVLRPLAMTQTAVGDAPSLLDPAGVSTSVRLAPEGGRVTFSLTLPGGQSSNWSVKIYDTAGRLVEGLGPVNSGANAELHWQPQERQSGSAAGMYFYHISWNSGQKLGRLVLLR